MSALLLGGGVLEGFSPHRETGLVERGGLQRAEVVHPGRVGGQANLFTYLAAGGLHGALPQLGLASGHHEPVTALLAYGQHVPPLITDGYSTHVDDAVHAINGGVLGNGRSAGLLGSMLGGEYSGVSAYSPP